MNDITSISLSLKECSSNEPDESNSNINGNIDFKLIEKDNCKAVEIIKADESVKKGISNIPVSYSMQDQPLTVLRSNKSLSSMSSDYIGNTGNSNAATSLTTESASFALLSRRESSLENLAEDETCLHNVCISPFVDATIPTIVEKPAIIENSVNIPKKIESSRLRRTLSSLLSCCTQKTRRSQYPYKTDLITTPIGDSDTILAIDKCSNISTHKQATSRSADGDHISFNCLKLKKFLDIFDEPDSPLKRGQQVTKSEANRSITTACITRDSDKSDSPSKTMKNPEAFQSENGGANLIRPVLLGTIKPADQGKKCFIIDLDETLVHSSFKMVEKADFKVGVDIEGTVHTVYVLKRPYVDVFLQRMGRIFECVLFTASLAKYADPVTDFLDKWRVFRWRLFRESCVFHRGNYVKDLSMLGRQADQVAILDNSPASYMFHPDNAVQITSWFDDPRDTALLDLIPYFEQLAAAPSVPPFLASVKPPQRATVPISVMLATPTSISLQPVSTQQLQNPQHTSSSPITSVEPCVVVSNADHHHSDRNTQTVSHIIHLPISSYIRSQIPSSFKSLSMISSKSMPLMYSEEECLPNHGAKFSRSETYLANLSSVVHNESKTNAGDRGSAGGAGAGGVGGEGGSDQEIYLQRVFSKSTSNIPTDLTYDDIFPKSVLNSLVSRSFPTLLPGGHCKSEVTEESQNGLQAISISKNSFLPLRSASFSVHNFPAEKTHRSSSLSEPRTIGIFSSLFTD